MTHARETALASSLAFLAVAAVGCDGLLGNPETPEVTAAAVSCRTLQNQCSAGKRQACQRYDQRCRDAGSPDSGSPTADQAAVKTPDRAPGSTADQAPAKPGPWMSGFISEDPLKASEPAMAIPYGKYTHLALTSFDCDPASGKLTYYYWTIPSHWPTFRAGATSAGTKLLAYIGPTDMSACASATNIDDYVNDIVTTVVGKNPSLNPSGVVFDGVDLDWEGAVDDTDVGQYEDLISRLRAAMPNKVITMDVFLGGPTKAASARQAIVDQINVMCYDMDGWASTSWYNSSIYGPQWSAVGDVVGCDALTSWIHHDQFGRWADIPYSKLGAGIPFYATKHAGCSAPLISGCPRTGVVHYKNLVTDASRWKSTYQVYDSQNKAEYLSIPPNVVGSQSEFIPYTGTKYVGDFVSWGKAKGLGGFLLYALDQEYLPSQSGDARWPLTTAFYAAVTAAP